MKNVIFVLLFISLRAFAQPDGDVAEILKESEFVKCDYAHDESFHIVSDKEGNVIALGLLFVKEESGFNYRAIKFNKDGERIAQSAKLHPFYKVIIQEDNKILFITSTYENKKFYGKVVRLHEDLSIDTDFKSPAELRDISFVINGAGALAIDKHKRVYIGGTNGDDIKSAEGPQFIYRLFPDGSLDKDFLKTIPKSPGLTYQTSAISIQEDGKILVAGKTLSANSTIIRLNEDGSLDESFLVETGSGDVYTMKTNADNKLLIGGSFSSCNGQTANKIARLLPDGSIDPEFNTGTGFGDHYSYKVRHVWFHDNGKIGVSGNSYQYNKHNIRQFVILNEDGSIWQEFRWSHELINLSSVYSICKISDKEVALFGLFKDAKYRIARIGETPLVSSLESSPASLQQGASLDNNFLNLYSEDPAEYYVYAENGRLLAQGKVENKNEHINVSSWPNALYIVSFNSLKGQSYKKLIKH